jgi:hypothetical protein
MEPSDLINGVTLTWQSVLFITIINFPTQHVSALLSNSTQNDSSVLFAPCRISPTDLSLSSIQRRVVWMLESVAERMMPCALVLSSQSSKHSNSSSCVRPLFLISCHSITPSNPLVCRICLILLLDGGQCCHHAYRSFAILVVVSP